MFFCEQLVTNAWDGWWSQSVAKARLWGTAWQEWSWGISIKFCYQWLEHTMEHVHWETNLKMKFQQSELWGTALPKRWRTVNRMYFLMPSLVLSGQVDFQLLQFNFLWPKRQVCHEPGTLHFTQEWCGGKEKSSCWWDLEQICPTENGHLNRDLRNCFIKKGIKNWPVNVLRAKAQCKCIDAT